MTTPVLRKRTHSQYESESKKSDTDQLDEKIKTATKKVRDKQPTSKTEKIDAGKIREEQVEVEKMASKQFEGWRIKVDNQSCGYVKFTPKVDELFQKHVSVDFAIPQPKRGRHIGRFALKHAIGKSIHKTFVAHLRKNNIPSQKSLLAVGFKETSYPGIKQLCMIFKK